MIVARHSQPSRLVYVVQPVKVLLIAAISLAGCDESTHLATDRPLTLAYVTETILAPTCGTAECHSTFHAEAGDVFDTVAGAQITMSNSDFPLVFTCDRLNPPLPEDCGTKPADESYLIQVLTLTEKGDRMPLDQVMSNADQELLGEWVNNGAKGLDLGTIHE